MARQAEAERERRAKIINSEGEFQAAAKLLEAADLVSQNPVTIQLRYLQTLVEVGGAQNSTIVLPLPLDLILPVVRAGTQTTAPGVPGQTDGRRTEHPTDGQGRSDPPSREDVSLPESRRRS
jgi:hypothetical protein